MPAVQRAVTLFVIGLWSVRITASLATDDDGRFGTAISNPSLPSDKQTR
jgi:hypothetical protein